MGFKGMTYGVYCHCPWWRRALDWFPYLRVDLHDESKHDRIPIISSRYAPATGCAAPGSVHVIPNETIDYAELQQAYESAKLGSEEPNLGVASLFALACMRSSKTGETIREAKQWLIENSELVEVDGEPMRRISNGTSMLLFYPEVDE